MLKILRMPKFRYYKVLVMLCLIQQVLWVSNSYGEDKKMLLGVNWKPDTTLIKLPDIFMADSARLSLGKNLQRILGDQGYIRYPGGYYVQEFPLDLAEAEKNYKVPGYPIFYRFCKENDLKVMQQLPTSSMGQGINRKNIKATIDGTVDWNLVDIIIAKTKSMVQWLKSNEYSENIIYWQIGNEDWIDGEGKLRPSEYVEIVARYIRAIKDFIPAEKILIVAQPGVRGGAYNWGYDVLKLLKERGLSNAIGGVTIHIYPYFLNRSQLDKPELNFESYCLGDTVTQSFDSEFIKLSDALDTLEYHENVKIHITETAVDIAGHVNDKGERWSFNNNRKNYAAAVAAVRGIMTLAGQKRWGGAAYYCLIHKYLVTAEKFNPTPWRGYPSVNDWGWGQCWYLPEQTSNNFLNTPLLEAWALLGMFFNGASRTRQLASQDCQAYMSIESKSPTVRLFLFNPTNKQITINLSGSAKGVRLGDGNLNRRAIKMGSYGDIKDLTPLYPEDIPLLGKVVIPAYGILFARGDGLIFNGNKITPD